MATTPRRVFDVNASARAADLRRVLPAVPVWCAWCGKAVTDEDGNEVTTTERGWAREGACTDAGCRAERVAHGVADGVADRP